MKRREVIKKILDRYFSGLIHYQYEVNHGVKGSEESFGKQRDYLQNQACDDWEKFLPSEEEIKDIVGIGLFYTKLLSETERPGKEIRIIIEKIAKAISKRIRGEK